MTKYTLKLRKYDEIPAFCKFAGFNITINKTEAYNRGRH